MYVTGSKRLTNDGAKKMMATALETAKQAGIAVSKGTPKSVIATLEAAIEKTVASPEFRQACERLAARPAFKSATEFNQVIAKEDAELARLMQINGLKKQP
jgi:tripartite-type tricarboxylate transporter receptor subunit TctC